MQEEEAVVAIVGMVSMGIFPTVLYYLRHRHKERMKLLEVRANEARVAALEGTRVEMEARLRTLETIATSGDRDLEARLRQLNAATAANPSTTPRLHSPQG
jgi:hypothetical protein